MNVFFGLDKLKIKISKTINSSLNVSILETFEGLGEKCDILNIIDTVDFMVNGEWNLIAIKPNKSFLCVKNFRGVPSRYCNFNEETEILTIVDEKEVKGFIFKNKYEFIAIIENSFYEMRKDIILSYLKTFIKEDGVKLESDLLKMKDEDNNDKKSNLSLAKDIDKKAKENEEMKGKSDSGEKHIFDIIKKYKDAPKRKEQELKTEPIKIKNPSSKKTSGDSIRNDILKTKTNPDKPEKIKTDIPDKKSGGSKFTPEKPENSEVKKIFKPEIKDKTPKKYDNDIKKIRKEYTYDENGNPTIKIFEEEYDTDLHGGDEHFFVSPKTQIAEVNENNDFSEVRMICESLTDFEINMTLSELGFEPSKNREENEKSLQKAMNKYGKKYVNNILLKHKF